jgi:hypothetical protein
MEWFLMGHLTEEEAVKIVNDSEKSFKFKPISEDDVSENRIIRLPTNYLAEFEEVNEDTNNPNSAIMVLF